jgi:hypothetical protein
VSQGFWRVNEVSWRNIPIALIHSQSKPESPACANRAVPLFRRKGESVQELAVQQRFLPEDEISDAKAMIGWQFWVAPLDYPNSPPLKNKKCFMVVFSALHL